MMRTSRPGSRSATRNPLISLMVAAGLALGAWAQQAPPKQPMAKSQKELDAFMAIQNAVEADSRLKAIENLLTNFADTQFKEFALQMRTFAYQEKNEFDKMLIAGEQTLEINPDNVAVLIMLGQALAQNTRELDLDKEEKLGKAEKFAKKSQALIVNLAKFNPQITEEQWTAYKKNAMAQSHEVVGMIAFVRKDYPASEKSFRLAVEVAPQADPTSLFRLSMALGSQNKFDEAIETLDKTIAGGGVQMGGKDLAAEQKAAFVKAKAAAAKPAAPAAPAAPPQVEIKRP